MREIIEALESRLSEVKTMYLDLTEIQDKLPPWWKKHWPLLIPIKKGESLCPYDLDVKKIPSKIYREMWDAKVKEEDNKKYHNYKIPMGVSMKIIEMGAKIIELALEKHTESKNTPTCGKGWAHRCASAKGRKCTCGCGGANHGRLMKTGEVNKETAKNFNGEIYHYTGFHGISAMCGLNIYTHNDKTIVVLTELPDNPGTSVTNMIEQLATMILHERLGSISRESIRWIEHYPAVSNFREETFDEVKMDWVNGRYITPQWQGIENIEDVIGAAINN